MKKVQCLIHEFLAGGQDGAHGVVWVGSLRVLSISIVIACGKSGDE